MNTQCPQCDSVASKKNGYTRHGKQNHRCLECGRQFSSENEGELVSVGSAYESAEPAPDDKSEF